ncbi:hydantoinase/oxoprolinase family protein, partial [Acinetobacter baumannii]
LGGGSHVDLANNRIGPLSVGYRLTSEALVFGGKQLTTSDIAVAAGMLDIGDRSKVAHLGRSQIDAVLQRAKEMIEEYVDRMKSDASDVV